MMTVYSMQWNTVTSIGHIVLIFNFKTVLLFHNNVRPECWSLDYYSGILTTRVQHLNLTFNLILLLRFFRDLLVYLALISFHFVLCLSIRMLLTTTCGHLNEFNNSIRQTCWLAVISLCRWRFYQDIINQPQSNLVSKLQFQIGLVS